MFSLGKTLLADGHTQDKVTFSMCMHYQSMQLMLGSIIRTCNNECELSAISVNTNRLKEISRVTGWAERKCFVWRQREVNLDEDDLME